MTAAHAIRVLYVDHDPDSREVMLRLLRRQVFEARDAGTCAEAITYLEAERIDLLITDYLLPDGDGLAVLTHARKLYPIEGVLITGPTDTERTEEGLLIRGIAAAHFACHLVRPIAFARLLEVIEALLDPRRRAALASVSVEAARSAGRAHTLREKVQTMTREELQALSTSLRRHGQDLREEIQVLGEMLRDGRSSSSPPVPGD
jgi:DNA-binding response OmpR family regulator